MSAEEPGGAAEADHIQLLHWPNDPHLSQVHLVTKTPLSQTKMDCLVHIFTYITTE